MDSQQAVSEARTKLSQVVEHFKTALAGVRTGRANPGMLEGVMVEAYGTLMPLNQVASMTVPEPQLLQLTPFDPANLQAIATAIRNNQSLGLNPADDGRVVRVPVPALTEERRRELAKQVGQKQEDCMVALRNVRHEALDAIDRAKKAKQLGEDDAKRHSGQIEEAVSSCRTEVENLAKAKEHDIMTV